jgi:CRP/FNR family transcriptional regulator, cyclic AMP receptor protein
LPATRADLEFLRGIVLFKDVTDADLEALWPFLTQRKLRKGEILLREGDVGREMFFLRTGEVIISKHVKGRVEQVLARMGPGDFFGEMGLFDRQPRSATIQADTDVVVLELDGDNLEQLVARSPRAASAFFYQMVRVFIQRLRDSTSLVAEVTRWGLEATGLDVEHT